MKVEPGERQAGAWGAWARALAGGAGSRVEAGEEEAREWGHARETAVPKAGIH